MRPLRRRCLLRQDADVDGFSRDVSHELARQLGELAGQMLILGIRGNSDLADRFGSLFAESRWPVLIVHRE